MNTAVILTVIAIGTLCCAVLAFFVLRALTRAIGRWLLVSGGKRSLRRWQRMNPNGPPEVQRTRELVERWQREDPERVKRDREAAERAGRITRDDA